MRYCKFNAVGVSNKKPADKPKFVTAAPKKAVEEPKVKKTRVKTEQTEQNEE